ncbi:MAG: hypothetical protein ACI9C4_001871 [Paraglaciecola sp.]
MLAHSLLPTVVSAGYRLGEITANTIGLKYNAQLESGRECAARIEYYQQDPKTRVLMNQALCKILSFIVL